MVEEPHPYNQIFQYQYFQIFCQTKNYRNHQPRCVKYSGLI